MAEITIAVIGSAGSISPACQEVARHVGGYIALRGFNLICGGLGGVMAAACEGFKQVEGAPGKTLGYLPGYAAADANPFIDIALPTGLDIGRNQLVVSSGAAVIAIGGGAGTLSEIALASQLGKPIGLVRLCGGWAEQLPEGFLDHRQTSYMQSLDTLEAVEAFIQNCANTTMEALSVNGWSDR